MPAKARKIPAYRLHKPTGQAVVRLDGRDHYLGRHGTEASQEAYRRTIAEWLVTDRPRPATTAGSTAPTINEVILAFWTRHAEAHYRRADGTPTGELANYRDSLRPLRRLFGHTTAREFSPLGLKAVRRQMIDSGLARGTINQRVGRVVRLFKWAASEEIVPAEAMEEFRAGQRRNRTTRLYPSQRLRTRKIAPRYAPGDHYSTRTYYHAVRHGCRKAGVPFWHPNRLRHSAATAIRTVYGLEAAQVVLGHAQMDTSEIYAEKNANLARRVAAEVG